MVFPKDKKLLSELGLYCSPSSGTCFGNKDKGVFILYSCKKDIIKTEKETTLEVRVQANTGKKPKKQPKKPKKPTARPSIQTSIETQNSIYLFCEQNNNTYMVLGTYKITDWKMKNNKPFVILTIIN